MAALLDIRLLVKDYQALRPLRVRELSVAPGRVLSLAGFDAAAAEIFVHLVTGASLPDEGDISLFGMNTRHIQDAEAWLHSLDGLGLVSHRAVLVDMLTVLQNVAMPLTLEVDPIADDMRPAGRGAGARSGHRRVALGSPAGTCRCRNQPARAAGAGGGAAADADHRRAPVGGTAPRRGGHALPNTSRRWPAPETPRCSR